MDKQLALDQIRHKRNALIYVCAGAHLLQCDTIETLSGVTALFNKKGIIFNPNENEKINGRMEIDLTQIVIAKHYSRSDFEVDLAEIYKFTRRNLIKETYEVVDEYANAKGILKTLKSQQWYFYARIIRNTVSHGLKYKFESPAIRAALPVNWEGKTIDVSMEGKEMTTDIADPLTTLRLIDEIHSFIAKN